MVFVGMTPDQIDVASRQLHAQVEELQSIKTSVGSLVAEASAHWNGSDLQRFRDLWLTTYQSQLVAAMDRIAHLADELTRQANDQRTTSAADNMTVDGGKITDFFNSLWEKIKDFFDTDPAIPPPSLPVDNPVDTSDDSVNPANVDQGDYGDCWFLATLGAYANTEEGKAMLRDHMKWDEEKNGYWVTLYRDGKPEEYFVGETFSNGANKGEAWESVYEAALYQYMGQDIPGGLGDQAMEILTGHEATSGIEDVDAIRQALQDGDVVVLSSNTNDSPGPQEITVPVYDDAENRSTATVEIVRGHAYMVVGVTENGNILVRNPWGPDNSVDGGVVMELTPEQYDECFRRQYIGSVD